MPTYQNRMELDKTVSLSLHSNLHHKTLQTHIQRFGFYKTLVNVRIYLDAKASIRENTSFNKRFCQL